jgi:hypothetical protein
MDTAGLNKGRPRAGKGKSELLYHVDDRQGHPWSKWNFVVRNFEITPEAVQGHSGKRGTHLQASKARRLGCRLTDLQNSAAHSAARPIRMNEKGAYLGRIVVRIEEGIFAAGAVVASIECLALTPAPAPGKNLVPVRPGFRHKIGPVFNKLRIHPKHQLQGLLSLFLRIVRSLQPQNRRPYETLERRNLGEHRLSDRKQHAIAE